MVRAMGDVTIVGAPTSAGAYAPGQEDGPRALRDGGLTAALEARGARVTDAGDIEAFRWAPDPDRPQAANAEAVGRRARQVAERVAAVPGDARALVLGGDCTVGVGTVAGLAAGGREPGLVYFDRHADLNIPASTIDGALDWMGVAHLLDLDGATDELAGVGPVRPLLAPERLAYLGLGPASPFEREQMARHGVREVGLGATMADPEAAARAALDLLGGSEEIAVHFDVDVLDFLDSPLAENTDRAPGVPLASAARVLTALLADPRVRALTVTEFNPHHGSDATTRRLVEALAGAFA
jgi:arginase